MKNINILILESSLLFILVVTLFRSQFIENRIVILLTAILILVFIPLSFFPVKSLHFKNIRFFLLISILIIIQGYMLIKSVGDRRVGQGSVHDGVIVTEVSYRALMSGVNPYSVNFGDDLNREKYFGSVPSYATVHFPYSPMMLFANVPIFWLTDNLAGFIDMRITLVIFFFFFLQLCFLYFKKQSLATVMLALATGTKLLILPLVPLYFLYLFMLSNKADKLRIFFKQFLLFTLVNLIVYLPFLIWNSHDLLEDLIFPWIGNGILSHPIAGFLGVPQILSRIGLIPVVSSFPFFLLALPFLGLLSIFSFYILKRSAHPANLCMLFALNILLLLSFSRLLQTYYLAFISQILLLSAFSKERE